MKSCETCRWVGCRNYGKDLDLCNKYIKSLEEERREKIEEVARNDNKTKDTTYNIGLRRIKQVGYNQCKAEIEVKYYCKCNNL